jgi:deoxyguanosine kinase
MTVYLSIGSNKNDRLSYLNQALSYIDKAIGQIVKRSVIFKTESWGYKDSDYLNMCVLIQTTLDPRTLLDTIKKIEIDIGRTYKTKSDFNTDNYQAREIDIDILFYEHLIVNTPDCTIPHAKLQERLFVLKPLEQIAPDFVHPLLNETIQALLKKCTDNSYATPYEE